MERFVCSRYRGSARIYSVVGDVDRMMEDGPGKPP